MVPEVIKSQMQKKYVVFEGDKYGWTVYQIILP
jgi:hypothetical protein